MTPRRAIIGGSAEVGVAPAGPLAALAPASAQEPLPGTGAARA